MAIYLTVDGGTTNTRVYLVKDRVITDSLSVPAGAVNGKEAIGAALRAAVAEILPRNRIEETYVSGIIASGMITSESGLCPVPHVPAPAGAKELAANLRTGSFPDICGIPFLFIPGVILRGDTPENTDVMRGEETELAGILTRINDPDALYLLPGSHSKLIEIDGEGRIVRFSTAMTGEILSAAAEHTILKYSTGFAEAGEGIREDSLYEGYEACLGYGINRALFSVRMKKNFFGGSGAECFGYLLGAVLCGEINQILASGKRKAVIGGQKRLREATALLLRRFSDMEVALLSDSDVRSSQPLGATGICGVS